MRLTAILLSLFVYINAAAVDNTYYYDYSENCSKGYQLLLSLQTEKGLQQLNKELKEHPNNLMPVYIQDYADCLLLLFNGDEAELEKLKGNLSKRIDQLEQGDKNSPWYRFCKAGLYMHWAFVYLRYNENLKAANYLRKSFALVKDNRKRFPDFEYNDVFYGIKEASMGAIPDNYKWVASIFGIKGDIRKGVGKLEGFLEKHDVNDLLYKEVVVYYAYLKFYLQSEKQEVWSFIVSQDNKEQQDLLYCFLKANIAVNYRKASDVITVLKRAQQMQGYNQYPLFKFEMAQAKLFSLDFSCIQDFDDFLKDYKGRLFIKDALMQRGYAYYLMGNTAMANKSLEVLKASGTTNVDADKQAARFAEEGQWPNKDLLKIRLLIDGGYYKKALGLLDQFSTSSFTTKRDQLEYVFRKARAYDELGMQAKAIKYYKETIMSGRARKEHFAARSALQMGFIYEHEGKPASAILMYKQAINMEGHDFENSIEQQAKAGVNRLSSNK